MNFFSDKTVHTVNSANINYYTTPFVHPRRKMNEHDFIYLLKGEWKIGQNERVYELKEDMLLILFAGNTHYGVSPCAKDTKTMYFHVSIEEGDRYDEGDSSGIGTCIDLSSNYGIKKLFEKVVNAKLSGEDRKASLYFELLVFELAELRCKGNKSHFLQNIINVIHSYPEKFFTNSELAEMSNVSVKTAETKFKAEFGKTIHQYILDFKMEEAKSYFEKFVGISVKEVAYNLGFCDEYHFSKQFSKYVGVSPVAYKKELKNKAENKCKE